MIYRRAAAILRAWRGVSAGRSPHYTQKAGTSYDLRNRLIFFLFPSFSFVPNWYLQLDALAELALPEPWRFRSGSYSEKNYDTPILERYIQSIFRKQVIDYNAATDMAEKDRIILMRNEYACFHTGLYTKRYKPI